MNSLPDQPPNSSITGSTDSPNPETSTSHDPQASPSLLDSTDQDQKTKTMGLSITEGSFAAINQSIFDNYLTPLALLLQAHPVHIGIMNGVAGLILPLGQLVGSRRMLKRSRKKILFTSVILQVCAIIGIMGTLGLSFIPALDPFLPYFLIVMVLGYNFFGGILGPSWVSMMGDIVPDDQRGRYFGKRNVVVNFFAICSSLGLALAIQFLSPDFRVYGFLGIFGIGGLMRMISGGLMPLHYDPPFKMEKKDQISFSFFLKTLKTNNFGHFTVLMALLNVTLWIAAPFFGVYMLNILQFDYLTYILLNVSTGVISLFLFPLYGKLGDKYGNRFLMVIGAVIIPIVPIMWVFFTDPWGIFFGGQVISSIAWTAFNLAASNFIYDNIPSSQRGEYQAHYSIIVGIGVIFGGLIGSVFVALLPFSPAWNFKAVFIISGVFRFIILAIFMPKIKEVRSKTKFTFSFRPQSIYRWLQEIRIREKRKNGKKPQ